LLQILESYLRATQAIEANPGQDPFNQMYIGTQKIAKLIDAQQIDNEIAAPSAYQIQRILIESVCSFSDNFVHVFQSIGVKLGTVAGSSDRQQKFAEMETSQEQSLCKQLV